MPRHNRVGTHRIFGPYRVDHLYSCTYMYPHGSIVLSAKELMNAADATAHYNSLATKYAKRANINGLAQRAFIALDDDDVVVRKDYKVPLVNVQGICETLSRRRRAPRWRRTSRRRS